MIDGKKTKVEVGIKFSKKLVVSNQGFYPNFLGNFGIIS